MITAYPYDPTGTNPECLIEKNEEYVISTYFNKWRCIIPIAAPFFRRDLVLKHKETDRVLLEGIDYYVGHRFVEASTAIKQMIYGSIFLIDTSLEGTIIFERYRTLGGVYNVTQNRIFEYLSTDFEDPRNCRWEDVLKHVVNVPPLHIPTDEADAIKTDLVTGKLNDIAVAIQESLGAVDAAYTDFMQKLNALEVQLDDWEVFEHPPKMSHPHNETPVQIGALGLTEDATDSFKAYGRTLQELTAMLNSMGITQKDIDAYATRAGYVSTGPIGLADGQATIANSNGETRIDLSNGNVRITVSKEFTLVANRANENDHLTNAIISGNNMLTLHSEGAVREYKRLIYNGYVVITEDFVGDFIPPVDPALLNISHTDSATTEIRGTGKPESKLYVNVKFATATPNAVGLLLVSDDASNADVTVACSSKATHSLHERAAFVVPHDRKINNKLLRDNPTITKADVGLGNVEDYSDAVMPLSNAFNAKHVTKAHVNHTHRIEELYNVPNATESVKGYFNLVDDQTYANNRDAASAVLIKPIVEDIAEAETNLEDAMPAEALGVKYFGINPVYHDPVRREGNNWVIPPRVYYCNSKEYKLPQATIPVEARTVYVYVDIHKNTDTAYIYTSTEMFVDGETRTRIGKFNYSAGSQTAEIPNHVSRLMITKEMRKHFDDPNAHGMTNAGVLSRHFRLDKVADHPQTKTISYPIHGLTTRWTGDSGLLEGAGAIATRPDTRRHHDGQIARKVIVPKSNKITIHGIADENVVVWINGKEINSWGGWDAVCTHTYDVIPNVPNDIVFYIYNAAGPTYVEAVIVDGDRRYPTDYRSWIGTYYSGKYMDKYPIYMRDIQDTCGKADNYMTVGYMSQLLEREMEFDRANFGDEIRYRPNVGDVKSGTEFSGYLRGTALIDTALKVPPGFSKATYMVTIAALPIKYLTAKNIELYVDGINNKVVCRVDGKPLTSNSEVVVNYLAIGHD